MKKALSIILSLVLVIAALPLSAVNSVAYSDETIIRSQDGLWNYYLDVNNNAVIYTPNINKAYFGSESNLTVPSIIDGHTVVEIGDYAFYFCELLTNVTIPGTVESIGDYAFRNCVSLTSITIPDGVTSIGNNAFYDCVLLTSITIPDGVTSIGNYAFYGCTSLIDITVDVNNPAYCSLDGVLFNKSMTEIICYPQAKTATTYSIPNSVTSIGDIAFSRCTSLTSIYIPDNVTSIGNEAFYFCPSLPSIYIPDSVTSIGYRAFAGCKQNFSICGVVGSYAETYANSNNIPFNSGYRVFISVSADGELNTSSIWSLKDNRETPNQYYNGSIINVAENGVFSSEDNLTLTLNVPNGYGCDGTITNAGVTQRVNDGDNQLNITPNGTVVINLHLYSRQDYTTLYFRNTNSSSYFTQKYLKTETSFTLPENTFSNLHGIFNSWNTSYDGTGYSYNPNDTIALPSADTTYYAIWDAAYYMSFNKNSGTGSMSRLYCLTTDPFLTVPECEFTRNGYAFTGWNTKANGSGTAYVPNTNVILSADMTLYAQWTRSYTVNLHSNFGNDETVLQEIIRGQTANIMPNPFSRPGYRFIGWTTNADGSGTSYADGASLNPTANVHLYAQWERDYDINDDGVEDINDIGFIISASAGNVEMTSAQTAKSDFNGDTVVDGFDAAWLDRYYS